MTPAFAVEYARSALQVAMLVSGPVLTAGLVVGLVVSIFQAVTQIHEASLAFIPKIVAMAIAAYLSAGWMIDTLLDFTRHSFSLLPQMGG
ncbi:MAG: flagellar biosynthesis protein FliQ [Myxococcales bacterium]|nr:flagellar biosynthesis protein FliQ [Myxococcales bacterium]